MSEVVSSLEDCQGWEQREVPQTTGEPNTTDIWPPKEQDPPKEKEGFLQGKKSCQGEGSLPEGSGYSSCLGRGDRMAEPPPHLEPVGSMSPFLQQGLLQT